jgi:hypothetical protein
MDVDFKLGGDELEFAGEVFADAMLGPAATGAGFLGLGDVVFDAVVGEMVERGSPLGACRLGLSSRRSGLGLRGRGGFDRDNGVVEVEEMTLAGVVVEAFAAGAEEIAAEQRQGLGQFGVFFLELVVFGGGGIEDPLEFIDAVLSVLGPPLSVFDLLVQLVVAAQQVVEQALALLAIVGEKWYDAHNMNYSVVFMLFKSIKTDFLLLLGLSRRAGTACVGVRS